MLQQHLKVLKNNNKFAEKNRTLSHLKKPSALKEKASLPQKIHIRIACVDPAWERRADFCWVFKRDTVVSGFNRVQLCSEGTRPAPDLSPVLSPSVFSTGTTENDLSMQCFSFKTQ